MDIADAKMENGGWTDEAMNQGKIFLPLEVRSGRDMFSSELTEGKSLATKTHFRLLISRNVRMNLWCFHSTTWLVMCFSCSVRGKIPES